MKTHAAAALTILCAMNAPTAVLAQSVVSESPAFDRLVAPGSTAELLYDGALWSEGPLALPDGSVIWSDIENNRVLVRRESGEVADWLRPAQFHNGHALDREGRVLAASHGKRGVERLEEDGRWRVLVDLYGEDKLNSPNDLVVDRRGRIWFTDPAFGVRSQTEGYGGREVAGGEFVYRFDPQSDENERLEMPMVAVPNGLAFGPDERILYIADSQRAYDAENAELNHHIVAYDVSEDGDLSNERVFAEIEPGFPDGIKVDEHGNVWSSSASGVQVFDPSGTRIGRIDLPEETANLTFGHGAVFITATTGLWRLPVLVTDANPR